MKSEERKQTRKKVWYKKNLNNIFSSVPNEYAFRRVRLLARILLYGSFLVRDLIWICLLPAPFAQSYCMRALCVRLFSYHLKWYWAGQIHTHTQQRIMQTCPNTMNDSSHIKMDEGMMIEWHHLNRFRTFPNITFTSSIGWIPLIYLPGFFSRKRRIWFLFSI